MQRNVLFILMPKNYRDEEFTGPYTQLKNAGHAVDVAGMAPGAATGVNGHEHTPNLLLDDLSNNDLKKYDALVIAGGPGSAEYLWDNPRIQEVIVYFHEHKKLIGTICHACVTAAQAGILEGKQATVYPDEASKEHFRKHNVQFVDQGCFVLEDERVITAQGPKDAEAFAQQLLIYL